MQKRHIGILSAREEIENWVMEKLALYSGTDGQLIFLLLPLSTYEKVNTTTIMEIGGAIKGTFEIEKDLLGHEKIWKNLTIEDITNLIEDEIEKNFDKQIILDALMELEEIQASNDTAILDAHFYNDLKLSPIDISNDLKIGLELQFSLFSMVSDEKLEEFDLAEFTTGRQMLDFIRKHKNPDWKL